MKCPYMDCTSLFDMYIWDYLDYANGHICKYLHGIHIGLGNLLKASQMIIQVSPKVEYILALLSMTHLLQAMKE